MFSFVRDRGPIIISAEVGGPTGTTATELILDTAATSTMLSPRLLALVGYDPDLFRERVRIAMGIGIELAPRVQVNRFSALGQHRFGFLVVCHALPAEVGGDGLIGLDFFRGNKLTIDFRNGQIDLTV